jgi:hypothetical protein
MASAVGLAGRSSRTKGVGAMAAADTSTSLMEKAGDLGLSGRCSWQVRSGLSPEG